MIETAIDDIRQKAKQLGASGKKWHFHMLTPECAFNKGGKQAFVLEAGAEAYVHYSDTRHMDVGKELVKLLHGDKIVEKSSSPPAATNPAVKKMLARAKQLNEKGVRWHFHLLFPDCRYNKHRGKWLLVFEDPAGGILEAVYENEPTADQKQIEVLYYSQKS